MTALVQYAYESFTGPSVASLDRLPAFIPVDGYDRRYYAQYYAGANDGASVSSWPDRAGSGTTLTTGSSGAAGATAPVMGTVGRERVVRFNGTTDALGQLYLNPEPYTITMVFYMPQAATNAWLVSVSDDGQYALFTNAANQVLWYGQARKSGPELKAGWHVLTLSANAAQTTIRLDGDTTTTALAGGGAYNRNRLTLAASKFNTNRARYDVAEVIHWPKALNADEVAAVHTALNSRYGL